MEEREARRLLGVGPEAGPAEVRSAFRRRIRARHPDVAGARGTEDATLVLEAYRVLRTAPAQAPPASEPTAADPPAPPMPPTLSVPVDVDGSTVLLGLPAGLAFAAVLEVAHGLGEVAYVDRSAGLVEVVVEFVDWPVCWVVLGVEPRPADRTRITVAVAALTGDPAPPEDAVAVLVADRLRMLTIMIVD